MKLKYRCKLKRAVCLIWHILTFFQRQNVAVVELFVGGQHVHVLSTIISMFSQQLVGKSNEIKRKIAEFFKKLTPRVKKVHHVWAAQNWLTPSIYQRQQEPQISVNRALTFWGILFGWVCVCATLNSFGFGVHDWHIMQMCGQQMPSGESGVGWEKKGMEGGGFPSTNIKAGGLTGR